MPNLSSVLLAIIGSGLAVAIFPYLFWMNKPSLSVNQRVLRAFGLYFTSALAALLIAQLWLQLQIILVLLILCMVLVPLFTLGNWINHRLNYSRIDKYGRLAEQARVKGNMELADWYTDISARLRAYYKDG